MSTATNNPQCRCGHVHFKKKNVNRSLNILLSHCSNATYTNLFHYQGHPLQTFLQKAHLQALLPPVGA